MKKLILAVLVLLSSAHLGWAGPNEGQPPMEAVKAEFARCMMCKHFLPVFDELIPVLHTEFVQLDSGMIMVHTVSDPEKVKLLHQVNRKMEESMNAVMQLSDADAKTQLCAMCQGMRQLTKAGAQLSSGLTKSGDVVVLLSSDPEVQKQIATFKGHCEAMMAGGH